jgi:hypothetical protein
MQLNKIYTRKLIILFKIKDCVNGINFVFSVIDNAQIYMQKFPECC